MADAKGKKGKKAAKKTVMSLDEFVNQSATAPSSTGLELDWASELENNLPSEPYSSSRGRGSIDKSALPSAPRSILGVELDLERIPEQAPFSVYMHNAPFEVTTEQINRYFLPIVPTNITLQFDSDRKKPPLIEFESRDMLIKALKERNDSMLGNRKVTLKLPFEVDSFRRDGGRDYGRSGGMGLDQNRRGSGPDLTLGNWRTAQPPAGPPSPTFTRAPMQEFAPRREEQRFQPREEEFRMERAPISPALPPLDRRPGPDSRYDSRPIERGPIERGPIERGHTERGPIERGPIERGPPVPADVQPFNQTRGPRFEALERADSRDDTMSRGSYGSHPSSRPLSRDTSYGDLPPPGFDGQRGGGERFTGGGRDSRGGGRRPMDHPQSRADPVIRRNDSFQRVETHGEDQGLQMRRSQPAFTPQISREALSRQESRDSQAPADQPMSRPKLQLAPRTKPVEEIAAPTGASSAIFGGAKPVDTTAREREVEEKRRKEEEAVKERIRLEIQEREKAAVPSKPLLTQQRSGSSNASNEPVHPRRDYPREQPPPGPRGGPPLRPAPVGPGVDAVKDDDWKRLQEKNRILRQTSSNASESSDRGSITDTRRVDEGELDNDLEEMANGEEMEQNDEGDFTTVVHGKKQRLPTAGTSSTAQYNSRVFSNSGARGGAGPRRGRGSGVGRGGSDLPPPEFDGRRGGRDARGGGRGGNGRGRGAPLRANGVQSTGGARKEEGVGKSEETHPDES